MGIRYLAAQIICLLLCCICIDVSAGEVEDAGKLFRDGQHAQALDQVDSYLAKNPKDAAARFLKGLIFTEQGKTADAIAIFLRLTEDYPEYPEPFNNLAVLYAGQEQYDKAKAALESAIRTHPSYATAHENLGDIYAKMASQAYDRALQLDHGNTSSQTKLNMIQNLFVEEVREKPANVLAVPPTPKEQTPNPARAPQAVPAKVEARIPPANTSAATASANTPRDSSVEVLKSVNGWAAAWSAQDIKKYLNFYAADFEIPANQSRATWEATRKERIAKPQYIKVTLSNENVNFADDEHATVTFLQSYRANHLKATGKKTLHMVKSNGKWLIRAEQSR
ncbi:MAG: tetratricopeptide repeat protein [Gallionella sp.]